jgi:hypothetical protein
VSVLLQGALHPSFLAPVTYATAGASIPRSRSRTWFDAQARSGGRQSRPFPSGSVSVLLRDPTREGFGRGLSGFGQPLSKRDLNHDTHPNIAVTPQLTVLFQLAASPGSCPAKWSA